MKEENMPLKEQCKYCMRSINTSHCVELGVRVKEDYNFRCPFFVFDDYLYNEEYVHRNKNVN